MFAISKTGSLLLAVAIAAASCSDRPVDPTVGPAPASLQYGALDVEIDGVRFRAEEGVHANHKVRQQIGGPSQPPGETRDVVALDFGGQRVTIVAGRLLIGGHPYGAIEAGDEVVVRQRTILVNGESRGER